MVERPILICRALIVVILIRSFVRWETKILTLIVDGCNMILKRSKSFCLNDLLLENLI